MKESFIQVLADIITTDRIPKGDKLSTQVEVSDKVFVSRNALGTILSISGYKDEQLREMSIEEATLAVARKLKIPTIHAALIDIADNQKAGLANALVKPDAVLGEYARMVMLLGKKVDSMTSSNWQFLDLLVRNSRLIEERTVNFDRIFGDQLPSQLKNGRNAAELAVKACLYRLRPELPAYFESSKVVQAVGIAVNEVQAQKQLLDKQPLFFVSLLSNASTR